MKKKILIAAMAISMAFSAVCRAEDDIRVYLDGARLEFDAAPVIRDNSALVPFRKIFESLGMEVGWNGEAHTGTAQKDGLAISVVTDSNVMRVNGKDVNLITPPIIMSERIRVPLRAVSEAAGADVLWDGDARTVTITSEEALLENARREVLALTNAERAKYGLNPLTLDDRLTAAADAHCDDMILRGYFDHINPDGKSPADRLNDEGIDYMMMGENIAAGQRSAEEAVTDWMNSEGHRENILNPDYKSIGIGVKRGGEYGMYWAQEFALFK